MGYVYCVKINTLSFITTNPKKKGLANYLSITCSSSSCDFSFTTYSSHHVNKPNTPGIKPFDVNARCIVAFREIGKGYNAIEKCFGLMNCLPSMDITSFTEMNKNIESYRSVAKDSMENAAKELRDMFFLILQNGCHLREY